jgi:hypothetical protein
LSRRTVERLFRDVNGIFGNRLTAYLCHSVTTLGSGRPPMLYGYVDDYKDLIWVRYWITPVFLRERMRFGVQMKMNWIYRLCNLMRTPPLSEEPPRGSAGRRNASQRWCTSCSNLQCAVGSVSFPPSVSTRQRLPRAQIWFVNSAASKVESGVFKTITMRLTAMV